MSDQGLLLPAHTHTDTHTHTQTYTHTHKHHPVHLMSPGQTLSPRMEVALKVPPTQLPVSRERRGKTHNHQSQYNQKVYVHDVLI